MSPSDPSFWSECLPCLLDHSRGSSTLPRHKCYAGHSSGLLYQLLLLYAELLLSNRHCAVCHACVDLLVSAAYQMGTILLYLINEATKTQKRLKLPACIHITSV